MDNKTIEKMNLQEYVLYVDSLTTPEFCKWQGIQEPYFTGEVKSSVDLFLQIDTIKYRLCKDKAKQQAKLASLLANPSEELREKFVDYCASSRNDIPMDIFDWFTPYLSKDADEVKELRAEIEKLNVRLMYLKDNHEIVCNNEKYYRERFDESHLEHLKIDAEQRDNRRKLQAEIVDLKSNLEKWQQDYSDLQSRNIELKSKLSLQPVNEWVSVEIEPENDEGLVLINKEDAIRTGWFADGDYHTSKGIFYPTHYIVLTKTPNP